MYFDPDLQLVRVPVGVFNRVRGGPLRALGQLVYLIVIDIAVRDVGAESFQIILLDLKKGVICRARSRE